MIGFWIAASLEGVACAVLILRFAARAQTAMDSGVPAADLAQRNLAEIDALAERGALNETERQGLRAETARRLLSETRQNESAVIRPIPRRVLLAAALAAPIIAVGLYLSVGSPGFGDQPFAKRVTAWRGSDPDKLTAPQMEAVLGQVAREHPNDPRPLVFTAELQAARGANAQAEATMRKARALMGPSAVQGAGPDAAQIRGMVEGLAARLKTSPDNPEGWVRLVRAYAVLGETEKMRAASAEARRRYAGNVKILNALTQAEQAKGGN